MCGLACASGCYVNERVCVKSRKTGRPTPICCGVVLVRPLHMDALRSFYTVSSIYGTGVDRVGIPETLEVNDQTSFSYFVSHGDRVRDAD